MMLLYNKHDEATLGSCPRGNSVMDKVLACDAGGRGSNPAVGKNFSNGLLSLGHKVVGPYL